MLEYKWKRTPYSKTYQIDRLTKKRVISLTRLHHLKGQRWTEINLRPTESKTGWYVNTPFYRCKIDKFPFKISVGNYAIRNLDSPNTSIVDLTEGLFFPKCGMKISFRAEGIEIDFKGTWMIDGEVSEREKQVYNFGPMLMADTLHGFLSVTNTEIPGEIVSHETVNGKMEVVFRHAETWLHDN